MEGEERMTEELTPNSHQYKIQFRCPNCGDVYSKLIQKGVTAQGQGGTCPTCGVKDGQPQVGNFKVIKHHPELDEQAVPNWSVPRLM